jgi:hypothetical protein
VLPETLGYAPIRKNPHGGSVSVGGGGS